MSLPPVALWIGPPGVGKRDESNRLLAEVPEGDRLFIRRLTTGSVRDLRSFARSAPVAHWTRVAVVLLRHASRGSVDALLKLIEDGSYARFLFVADDDAQAPETLRSRAVVRHFTLLSDAEVADRLQRLRFGKGEAERLASLSGGQVGRALATREVRELKPQVLVVVKAFQDADARLLESVTAKWTDEHTDLLVVWCQEAITQRWRIFLSAESEVTGVAIPLRILRALRDNTRARLTIRAGLMSALREE